MIKDDNNTFNEELEKELQSGLHNTLDEGQGQDQDFTVKVHREEYVVKRRFYDKEKALETVEDLKRDKRNIVEDNLEGQALSSDNDDEEVDWDKLVDAGLQFDPPIAQAADLKPGDQPVSLIKPIGLPVTDDDHNKDLEKTFLVKLNKPEKTPDETHDEDTFSSEVEREVDEVVIEEDETDEDITQKGNEEQATENVEDAKEVLPGKKRMRSRYAGPMHSEESPKRSKRNLWVVVLVIAACISALFWSMQSPNKETHTISVPQQIKEITGSETPGPKEDKPVTEVQNGKSDVVNNIPSPDNTIPAQTHSETTPDMTKVNKTSAPEVITAPLSMNKNGLTIVEPLPFTVHVSSYKLITEVDKAIEGLKGMGHVAFSGLVNIPGKGDWYRIYAGCFRSLDEASALASDIKKALGEDANAIKAPWAIQIGKPTTSSEAEKQLAILFTKGYRAYLLTAPDNKGSIRILIGAFPSEKAATTMVNTMKKEGFKASPALR